MICHISLSLPLSLYLSISIYLIFLACLTEGPTTDDPGECWKRASLCGSSGNTHTSCRRIFWALSSSWLLKSSNCCIPYSLTPHLRASHSSTQEPSMASYCPESNMKSLIDIQQTGHWPSSYLELKLLWGSLKFYYTCFPQHTCLSIFASKVPAVPNPHWISVFLQNSPLPVNPPFSSSPSSRD